MAAKKRLETSLEPLKEGYIKPHLVIAPKIHWVLFVVISDNGEGKMSYAIGTWDHEPVFALRRNGTTENPLGSPQSRGLPTWLTIHDSFLNEVFFTFFRKKFPNKTPSIELFFKRSEELKELRSKAKLRAEEIKELISKTQSELKS